MSKVIIIAEAGVNHNGNIENAFKLIDAAADAGVDYVKFQTFKTENLVSKVAPKAEYQNVNSELANESQFEMLKKLELTQEDHEALISYCHIKNINFFSTAFDLDSLEYLSKIGLNMVKIPSGEITNLPFLRKAASLFKEVILSTGMSTINEIEDAIKIFTTFGIIKENIIVLHCNSEYPTPMEDVNLKAMMYIHNKIGVKVGYSDHTIGIEVPIAAVALGAQVIEKHFTLDCNLPGPDHKSSLEPMELKAMVNSIRNIEKAISGTGIKMPTQSELKNKDIARKSIVAARNIIKGEVFTNDNITSKRPGGGISPMCWDNIVDRIAIRDFDKDEFIEI